MASASSEVALATIRHHLHNPPADLSYRLGVKPRGRWTKANPDIVDAMSKLVVPPDSLLERAYDIVQEHRLPGRVTRLASEHLGGEGMWLAKERAAKVATKQYLLGTVCLNAFALNILKPAQVDPESLGTLFTAEFLATAAMLDYSNSHFGLSIGLFLSPGDVAGCLTRYPLVRMDVLRHVLSHYRDQKPKITEQLGAHQRLATAQG